MLLYKLQIAPWQCNLLLLTVPQRRLWDPDVGFEPTKFRVLLHH